MKHGKWSAMLALAVAVACQAGPALAQPDESPASTPVRLPVSQQGQSCHLPNHEDPLRCVSVVVPIDYANASGDQLTLHVTVAPAFRELAKPDPLFVLAGGPGQAGSDIVSLLERAFKRVRATRDIVFIDQRGTGKSGKLSCDFDQLDDNLNEAEQEKFIADCLGNLNAPLQHYTTASAARDLDAVRQALGYGQINVWGGSYGTRLGQAYARAFPEQVRALVLDSVAAPEQILGAWGEDADHALEAVFQHCEQDRDCRERFPQLRVDFRILADNVASGSTQLSFTHPRTTKPTAFVLPYASFAETIRTMLYSTDTAARIPFLISESNKGNWKPFVAQMFAQSDWSADSMAVGLTMAVICAEDMPRLTPARIDQETAASFLKGLQVKQWPRWCEHIKVPAVNYREPTPLATPTLLLEGALDPVTPPARAVQAMQSLSNAQLVVVKNAGHIVSHLGCAPKLLREFIDTPALKLDASCVDEIPLPPFVISAAGPTP